MHRLEMAIRKEQLEQILVGMREWLPIRRIASKYK